MTSEFLGTGVTTIPPGCNFLYWCDGQAEDIGPRVPRALGWETTVPSAVLEGFGLSQPEPAHGSLVSTSPLDHPPDTAGSSRSMLLWVP